MQPQICEEKWPGRLLAFPQTLTPTESLIFPTRILMSKILTAFTSVYLNLKKKVCLVAAELAQQFIALDVLPADGRSIPSTFTAAIIVCNSILRGSDTLAWFLCALHTHGAQTRMQKSVNIK